MPTPATSTSDDIGVLLDAVLGQRWRGREITLPGYFVPGLGKGSSLM
ncbi:lipid-transfer protein [Roseobacter sp. MED193]|nr:lipid-transfer protein [Roseobacter sp. MED193]